MRKGLIPLVHMDYQYQTLMLATELLERFASLGLPPHLIEKLVAVTLTGAKVKIIRQGKEIGVFVKEQDDTDATR